MKKQLVVALAAPALMVILSCGAGCSSEPVDDDGSRCAVGGGAGAVSTCLVPKQSPEYYIEQSNKYFDTLDTSADPSSIPNYSELVSRWEWSPWLLLTGIGREMMIESDKVVIVATPSTVPSRDCRAFPVQPFGRCRVSFLYAEGACPIYEEFTFNDQGEITFIEAWTDGPGFLPTNDPADHWAEGPEVHRLSTKVPGLGNAEGRIDLNAEWMEQAALEDGEIADFVYRAKNFWPAWSQALRDAGEDYFARGCGW
jgi:hypothetical protein